MIRRAVHGALVLALLLSGPSAQGQEQQSLKVFSGRGIIVDSPAPLARVSVSDPAIASASVISPTQVMLTGQAPGAASLMLWDTSDRVTSYDVRVEADLGALREVLKIAMPRERIEVTQSGGAIVLTGTASSKATGEKAVALAQAHSKTVVNALSEGGDQVMLQVRFAEVNKVAISELGLTLFSTGATNTLGVVTTGQFGQTTANVGAIPSSVQGGRPPSAPNVVSGAKAVPSELSPGTFGLTDLLNVFFFRPDLNFGAAVRALSQRNLLEILAEPNLLARSGSEASFLAGGEFPFPILQPSSGGNAVTIEFKEFGVRLRFTPTVLPDESINIKVIQEVSALDFSNALTVSGFVIPAIAARRAETEIQLRDGQTFAIAGLIDNRVTEVGSRIAGLGDLPIIGKFFRSRSKKKDRTELLATVTPRLVRPLAPGETVKLPQFPEAFIDQPKGSQPPATPAPLPGAGSR
jgi:pilus assembly protein CpaC